MGKRSSVDIKGHTAWLQVCRLCVVYSRLNRACLTLSAVKATVHASYLLQSPTVVFCLFMSEVRNESLSKLKTEFRVKVLTKQL